MDSGRRNKDSNRRRKEDAVKEKAFEAEIDERIKTIGAEIRAENMQRMLDLDVNNKEDDQW